MKIYIEDISPDKVRVIDYGDLDEAPKNTIEVDVPNGKFDDTFRLYKKIQVLNEDPKWESIFTAADVSIGKTDAQYIDRNGKALVYYKSNGVVAWDDIIVPAVLVLTSDATDSADPYKGIPDIQADGVSECNITILKKDYLGNALTGDDDNDSVMIETSRGRLNTLRVSLVKGTASVILISSAETCVARVKATADGLESGNIDIQFAP